MSSKRRKTHTNIKKCTKRNDSKAKGAFSIISSQSLASMTSKPMLMIPQPVLEIHGLDTNFKMSSIVSNIFTDIDIKEEPVDVDYEEESEIRTNLYQDTMEISATTVENIDSANNNISNHKQAPQEPERRRSLRSRNGDANNNKKELVTNTKKKTRLSTKKDATNEQTDKVQCAIDACVIGKVTHDEEVHTSTKVVEQDESITENNNGSPKCRIHVAAEFPVQPHTNVNQVPSHDTGASNSGPLESDLLINIESHIGKGSVNQSSNEDLASKDDIMNKEKNFHGCKQCDASYSSLEELQEHNKTHEEKLCNMCKSAECCCGDDISEGSTSDVSSFGDAADNGGESKSGEDEDVFPKLWKLKDEERQSLVCSVCKKKFSRVSILAAHKKKHFDPNIYNCTHCNKVFSSESSYKHHIAYSGLAPYKCDKCGKSYYTEMKCAAHKEQCMGKSTERKYKCEECGRAYIMLCSLRTHIRERHSDFKPVKNLCCEFCGKRFRHRKYLDLHMFSHSTEKNFECNICHRKYKSCDILRHHIRMVHKNPPKVKCEICQKEISRVSLKAHINRHREKKEEEEESARVLDDPVIASNYPRCDVCHKHFENDKILEMHCCNGRDDVFSCPHCNNPFNTAMKLVQHTCQGQDNSKSRNSSKVYKCIFCRREYTCHTPWLYHVRHHTGDKPYPCSECDKSFRLKQGLKVHMRNHTGEKPFTCHICPAAFKQKPFLLDHINTHTGQKPYQCERCLARFSVRSALSTHKRIHRRELKEFR